MVFGRGLKRANALFKPLEKVVFAVGGGEIVGSDHFAESFLVKAVKL